MKEIETKFGTALAYVEQLECGDARENEEQFERVFALEAKLEETMKNLQDERARISLSGHVPGTRKKKEHSTYGREHEDRQVGDNRQIRSDER